MDMWEAYIGATRDGLPAGDEKIVFDRFHIMREMTKAVDTVRKQEYRAFLRAGEGAPLTGTKSLWLFSDERRPERHAAAVATLQALKLKVWRAWAIKEALRALWTYRQHAAREAVLHALVWLGDPRAARAREAGGEDVEAASRRGGSALSSIRSRRAWLKVSTARS